jgi:hypothetical protein
MKKLSVFFAVVVLGLAACERHPASQLAVQGEGGLGVRGEERGGNENKSPIAPPNQSPTRQPSPTGTPKSYFPQ